MSKMGKTPMGRRAGKQKGYTLIIVMLLLASMAMVATLQFRSQVLKLDMQKATIAGKQMRMVDDAVEGYVGAHNMALAGMADNDCSGSAGCAPSAWYCAVSPGSGDQCELDLSRLVGEGYLPPGWKNVNAWGSAYKTVVTRVLKPNAMAPGNPMDYNVRAITVTQSPWVDGGRSPLLGLLGQAVRAGGPDLAMTSLDASTARGLARRSYNAAMSSGTLVSWSADNSMNPSINGVGQLVARAGFEASANSSFPDLLRRDGSRMMKNDLNLGVQRINNVQDAYVKKISGGRNLAALGPTWVFKYSWRVDGDGALIEKPDCRAQSGGWTSRTTLANPWDPSYAASDPNKAYDNGEPRILLVNDTLSNLKALGYLEQSTAPAGYNLGATCAAGITTSSPPNTTTCPANDPNAAYDPALRARARAAYTFYAIDNGVNWSVNMKYHQNGTTNTAGAPANAQGIASIYCYYDNQQKSGCNGEVGCSYNGAAGPGAAAADLARPPVAASDAFAQSPMASGRPSQPPPGLGAVGAGDVAVAF